MLAHYLSQRGPTTFDLQYRPFYKNMTTCESLPTNDLKNTRSTTF